MKRVMFALCAILAGAGGCADDPARLETPVTVADRVAPAGTAPVRCGNATEKALAVEFTGIAKVGIVLVEFAGHDDPDHAFTTADENTFRYWMFNSQPGEVTVHNFFQKMSGGVDGFEPELAVGNGGILGRVTIDEDWQEYCGLGTSTRHVWMDAARDEVSANGWDDRSEFDYDILMYVFQSGNACTGNVDGEAFYSWGDPKIREVAIYTKGIVSIYAHELGHHRGFQHSGLTGNSLDYQDLSCVMGGILAPGGGVLRMRELNAVWRDVAGYPVVVKEIGSPGIYDLEVAPLNETDETVDQILKVQYGASPPYYVSYRAGTGVFDEYFEETSGLGLWGHAYVHSFVSAFGTSKREAILDVGDTFEGDGVVVDLVAGPDAEGHVTMRVIVQGDCETAFTAALADASAADDEDNVVITYHTEPIQLSNTAIYDVTIVNEESSFCTPVEYSVTSQADLPEHFGLSSAVVEVAPGETGEAEISLVYFNQDRTGPAQGTIPFTVTVQDPDGGEIQEFEARWVYDTEPPPSPTNLAATRQTNDVVLGWSPVTDPVSELSHYVVTRNDGAPAVETTSNSYVVPGVAGACMTFTVVAVDKAGHTSGGASVDYAPAPGVVFSTSLRQSPFPNVGHQETFVLEVTNTSCDTETFTVEATNTQQFTLSADPPFVTVGAEQTVQVSVTMTVIDALGDGDYPLIVSVGSVPATAMYRVSSVPAQLDASMTDVNEVTVTWDTAMFAGFDIDHYEVERVATPLKGSPTTTYFDVSASPFVDDVNFIQRLDYRVRAVSSVGHVSAWSAGVRTGCPKCPPPIGS